MAAAALTMLISWLACSAICAWLLFFGGADRIANGWLTGLIQVPGMDEREVKFAAVIGWLASTVVVAATLLS